MGVPGRSGEKLPPLVAAGDQADDYPGTETILFRATVENSDCATDVVQSRLTGLQLCLAVTPNHGDKRVR
jgi:hypothetical protein